LQRFEAAMRSLPARQRKASLLPLLHNYQRSEKPIRGSVAPTDRFPAAVQEAKIGTVKDIPHVSAPISSSTSPICKGSDCSDIKQDAKKSRFSPGGSQAYEWRHRQIDCRGYTFAEVHCR
jgi:hypothetical protein